MKALLLAAGLGTRLRPITNTIPKSLVPINGKPLLEYWLENLDAAGVSEFLINTHYLHKEIEKYILNSKFSHRVTLVYEEKLLNTAGTILANEKFFRKNESFMLVHADNLSICNFKEFINSHKKRPLNAEITMMLFRTDNPSSCGIVELNNYNIVKKFYEKVKEPPSNLANGAVYICEPAIIDFLKTLNKNTIDFSVEVLPHYIGKINTYLNNTYHRDIGTVESYALSQIEITNFL